MRFFGLPIFLIAVTLVLVTANARGQTTPFFNNAGVIGFDPQVSTLFTGDLIAQQAVVSHDLKYVTINTQSTSSRLIALQPFAFQGPSLGFVGSVVQTPTVAGAGVGLMPGRRPAGASPALSARPTVLDQPGMTMLSRLP
jgi:hypothetical protein